MVSDFKTLVVFMSLLATVSCYEITLDSHESSKFEKRDKFAFAKRYPWRFAFAKRYDYEDITNYDKEAVRFNSPIHYMGNFAYAKRVPYLLFA